MSTAEPLRLVVMGVSGSGKSTLASALGEALHLRTVDGDDLHLPESVRKMSAGIALTDEDRWPWLDRVATCLQSPLAADQAGCVVACSALRRVYRDHLRAQVPGLRFVFLDGPAELLRQRMAQRTGHFMQLKLLESQLDTLEKPAPDEPGVLTVPAHQSIEAQIELVCARSAVHPLSTPSSSLS